MCNPNKHFSHVSVPHWFRAVLWKNLDCRFPKYPLFNFPPILFCWEQLLHDKLDIKNYMCKPRNLINLDAWLRNMDKCIP